MRMAENPGKSAYHHGDLATALLFAVDEIIREKGVGSVSLREAARRAGVSHSAPAHHFGDKEGLLAAFAEQGFGHLSEVMTTAMAGAADLPQLEQMSAIGKAYVKLAAEYPAHFDVMFRSGLDKSKYPSLHQTAEITFAFLHERTSDLVAQGVFPDANPDDLAAFFWSLVHGLAVLWVDGSLQAVLGDRTLDSVIEGALAAPSLFAGEQP